MGEYPEQLADGLYQDTVGDTARTLVQFLYTKGAALARYRIRGVLSSLSFGRTLNHLTNGNAGIPMNTVAVIWRSFLFLIFGASLLVGLAAVGYQAFLWAKTGEWVSIPLAQAFLFYGVDLSPVYNPQDWKGVASATAWTLGLPLFLMAPIIGSLVCTVIRNLDPFGIEDRLFREELSAEVRWRHDPPA